jgi:hypothetical protein
MSAHDVRSARPVVKITSIASEMPAVWRERMVITAWGTKDVVVRIAAARANHSVFIK